MLTFLFSIIQKLCVHLAVTMCPNVSQMELGVTIHDVLSMNLDLKNREPNSVLESLVTVQILELAHYVNLTA